MSSASIARVTKLTRAAPVTASSSGGRASSPISAATSSGGHPSTNRQPMSSRSIWLRLTLFARTGRSFAIDASTPTATSLAATSTNDYLRRRTASVGLLSRKVSRDAQRTNPQAARLSPPSGMGAARSDLALLAAQRSVMARKNRLDFPRLFANGLVPGPFRNGPHQRQRRRNGGRRLPAPTTSGHVIRRSEQYRLPSLPDERCLVPRPRCNHSLAARHPPSGRRKPAEPPLGDRLGLQRLGR